MPITTFTETIVGLVPSGKAMGWLLGSFVAVFAAGWGVALGTGDYADLPEEVGTIRVDQSELRQSVADNARDIRALRTATLEASEDRERILCLVELAASNEQLPPLEVNRRCP